MGGQFHNKVVEECGRRRTTQPPINETTKNTFVSSTSKTKKATRFTDSSSSNGNKKYIRVFTFDMK
jgi:hypothetical protein